MLILGLMALAQALMHARPPASAPGASTSLAPNPFADATPDVFHQSAGAWGNTPPPPPPGSPAQPSGPVTLMRDGRGQFHLTAQVNGQDTDFLVDTGADVVALTEAQANRLGLNVAPADFRPVLRTASGTAMGAPVHLDRLVLAGRSFADVDAVVIQGAAINLLGQSALRRLARVELRGDTMVLDPGS
ncbi:MAG TPA: TIGR02281 family clan AA aspartic protease [Novosphingobium sp.]|nr:TIGR02281 family clan AA aspartic protease [Novosphingobium sp.]